MFHAPIEYMKPNAVKLSEIEEIKVSSAGSDFQKRICSPMDERHATSWMAK